MTANRRPAARFRLGDSAGALEDMERSIDRVRDLSGAYFELGRVYLAQWAKEHRVALGHVSPEGTEHDLPAVRSRIGISASFDLRSSRGPLDLFEDQLVRVTTPRSDARVPSDLYLRCAYFDKPGLDRWDVFLSSSYQSHDLGRDEWRKASVHGVPDHTLQIERLEGHSGLVYVPPGTYRLVSRRGAMRIRVSTAHRPATYAQWGAICRDDAASRSLSS